MAAVTVNVLVETIQQTGILKPDQLQELTDVLQVQIADPHGLARELVQRGWLTTYQAKVLLVGRGRDLVFGPYFLMELLGVGGRGQVFKARHQPTDKIVALKVLRKDLLADSEAIGRFMREVEVMSKLVHPAIVCAYDAGTVANVYYLTLEFVNGVDLEKLVKQQGPLPAAQACDYIRQSALGLQYAHEKGMVHRDIKPSNLLVDRAATSGTSRGKTSKLVAGSTPWGAVKVLDLGLARMQELPKNSTTRNLTTLAGPTVMMGTPEYMAPEQAMDFSSADIRADVYSLGCTLYYLLTGKLVFTGKTMPEKLIQHQMSEPPPLEAIRKDLPPGLSAVCRKCLAKKPTDRYQTPGELALALAPLATPPPPSAAEKEGDATLEMLSERTPSSGILPIQSRPPSGVFPLPKSASDLKLPDQSPSRPGPRLEMSRRKLILLLAAGGVLAVGLLGLLMLLVGGSSDSGPHVAGTTASAGPTLPDKHRTAVQFNGVDNVILLPDNLFKRSDTLTLEVWFKADRGGGICGYQQGVYPAKAGSHVPTLFIGTDKALRGEFWYGQSNPIATKGPVADNQWHHVALVADGPKKTQSLYLDGTLVGTQAGTINHLDMNNNQVGAALATWSGGNGGWFPFTGALSELRVWYSARSAAEIQQTMRKPLTGSEIGLAAYWPLDEGQGDILVDRTGYNRMATLAPGTKKPATVNSHPFNP
ncbi:MAG: protein kinase [Gemmataceae bacterium]|nr:protein kinase [Gemmataceae bacterium]